MRGICARRTVTTTNQMNATTTLGFVVSGMWKFEPEPAWWKLRRVSDSTSGWRTGRGGEALPRVEQVVVCRPLPW